MYARLNSPVSFKTFIRIFFDRYTILLTAILIGTYFAITYLYQTPRKTIDEFIEVILIWYGIAIGGFIIQVIAWPVYYSQRGKTTSGEEVVVDTYTGEYTDTSEWGVPTFMYLWILFVLLVLYLLTCFISTYFQLPQHLQALPLTELEKAFPGLNVKFLSFKTKYENINIILNALGVIVALGLPALFVKLIRKSESKQKVFFRIVAAIPLAVFCSQLPIIVPLVKNWLLKT